MTAHRVIDDHNELENSGVVSHSQLDSYVNTTPWLIISGVSGAIPPSARKLVAGSGVSISDGGAGGNLTISSTGGGGGSTSIIWNEIPTGDNDGNNKSFELTNPPSPTNSLLFFINGIKQYEGITRDYTLTGSIVNLTVDYTSGSNIEATYQYAGPVVIEWNETPTGDNDGINKSFTLAYAPSPSTGLMFFINGVKQRQGINYDYTLSGSLVNLIVDYTSGSNIDATYPH